MQLELPLKDFLSNPLGLRSYFSVSTALLQQQRYNAKQNIRSKIYIYSAQLPQAGGCTWGSGGTKHLETAAPVTEPGV